MILVKKIELNINGKIISMYGTNLILQCEKDIIEKLNLTGNEYIDRLIIQECIDDNRLRAEILYDGNTVYSFEKTVKEYRKLQKSGTLDNLSKNMYDFFMYACGDIAHYDIAGYKCYYDYSFRKLENELLSQNWTASRFTDRDRIFKELKISKEYFKNRESIDINKISTNKLKSIIKECEWEVTETKDKYWELSKNIDSNTNYSFNLDILTRNTSDILKDINYIAKTFNKDSYSEMIYAKREKNNGMTISEIVSSAYKIKSELNTFASDVLYKTRIAAEEKISILNRENVKKNDDFNYEY